MAGDLIYTLPGQFQHLLAGLTGNGMVNNDHGMGWHPQSLGSDCCGFDESLGNDRRSGPTAFFRFNTVVETPRCARASIGYGVNDGIAF